MSETSLFSEDDLYLFAEGTWLGAYEKMGAHPRSVDGVEGTNFAVWAPGAASLRVEIYGTHERNATMRRRGSGGIWEAFVPGVTAGDLYKYALFSRYDAYTTVKSDPFGFTAEVRPNTASIVYDIGGHAWSDAAWMSSRAAREHFSEPISIYEVHAGSWRKHPDGRFLTYRELAHELVAYVQKLGYTHIELLPVTEHPFDISFGYQTTGYFAPTSRYGTPHDFMYFVDYCHLHGIGVLLDWVPSHFAKEGHGLGFFDGTHLYEHADPREGEHLEWGTFVFNYGRHEVLTFLLSNAHYWLREYHIDGFRVDAVASMLYRDYLREEGAWVANMYGGRENLEAIAFLRQLNDMAHQQHAGVLTFAEESTAWQGVTQTTEEGGLGFDFKWNMGWMNDVLRYFERDPVVRQYHQNEVTFSFMYAHFERFVLPLSHDEVIHLKRSIVNKAPGDLWQRFASMRALYAFMYAHPGKKLLFMGGEFGQHHEWEYAGALEWHLLNGNDGASHRQAQSFVAELNRLYSAEPALHEGDTKQEGFAWIDGTDEQHSVLAFLRRAITADDYIAIVCNWTPVPREAYQIGVPVAGAWEEILNSDAALHGGSGVVNGRVLTNPLPMHGFAQSLTLTLPPLAVVWLKIRGDVASS